MRRAESGPPRRVLPHTPETLRVALEGRRIHPRTLFWAVEHGLTIDAVPGLRCGCGNPLCILPAHA